MGRLAWLPQLAFTSGELDPLLAAREDTRHYFSGVERGRNVFVIPQGGAVRRPGLRFFDDLGTDPANGVRLVPFTKDLNNRYVLVFVDSKIEVYKNGVFLVTISSTPWDGTEVETINWAQATDEMVVVHKDVAPQIITSTNDLVWGVNPVSFDFIPKFDFVPATPGWDRDLTPSATTGTITLTISGGGADIFDAAKLNQKISVASGSGTGLARIINIQSSTVADAFVEIPFHTTSAIPNADLELLTGFEDVWSVTRGFPAAVTFRQGRMFLGGGSRANTLYGSRVGAQFDFEPIEGLDDEPVEATIDADTQHEILNLFSGNQLQVFTSEGEGFVPQAVGNAITPTDFHIQMETQRGSKQGVRPVLIDGGTMFVQREGKAIREFLFTDVEQRFSAENLSLLSSHLIVDPVDFTSRRSTNTEEADYLLAVNSDGSLAVCCILPSQNVLAWTLCTTEGSFLRAAVSDTDMHFVVQRVVDGTTKFFLECFDFNFLLDSAIRSTAPAPIYAMPHLPNTSVRSVINTAVQAVVTSNSTGDVTVPRAPDAGDTIELGLDFPTYSDEDNRVDGTVTRNTPHIRPMPLSVPSLPDGTMIGRKKRIVEATFALDNTVGFQVNGTPQTFRKLGSGLLDTDPPAFTGRHTIEGLLGHDEYGQIDIEQDIPQKMRILAISQKASL